MSSTVIHTEHRRILYLDYLRIFATIAVILLHVSAQNWDSVGLQSYERIIFTIYNNTVGWCVNMFMMISGALFLDNDRPLSVKKLFKNNILRIFTAFCFWSAIYAADQALFSGTDLRSAVRSFLQGHYHMWFLAMIIAYYASAPVLRKITESRKLTEYFLILVFLWAIGVPSLLEVLNYFNPPHTAMLAEALSYHHSVSNFGFQRSFLFYYVLGFYLTKYEIPRPVRLVIPVLAVPAYLCRLLLTLRHTALTGSGAAPFTFLMCDLVITAGLFLFSKYVLSRIHLSQAGLNILSLLSNYSFGVYLVHALVITRLQTLLGLDTLSFNPILSVPIVLLAVLIISYCLSALLHRVPVLKKYVV